MPLLEMILSSIRSRGRRLEHLPNPTGNVKIASDLFLQESLHEEECRRSPPSGVVPSVIMKSRCRMFSQEPKLLLRYHFDRCNDEKNVGLGNLPLFESR